MTAQEMESLCQDGETLDALVKRFEQRCADGMKFQHVLTGLAQAKSALDAKMNTVADAVDRELRAFADQRRPKYRYRVTTVHGCMIGRIKVGDVLLYDEYKGKRKFEEIVDTKTEDLKYIGGWDMVFLGEKTSKDKNANGS